MVTLIPPSKPQIDRYRSLLRGAANTARAILSPVRVSTVRQILSEDEHSEAKIGQSEVEHSEGRMHSEGQMHSETEHSEYREWNAGLFGCWW